MAANKNYRHNVRERYHVFARTDHESDTVEYYLYHPYSQSIFTLNENEAVILRLFEHYERIEAVKEALSGIFSSGYVDDVIQDAKEQFSLLRPNKIDEDLSVRTLCLIVTDDCNMRCRYCYALHGKIYKNTDTNGYMAFDAIKNKIDFILERHSSIDEIMFFGGEPLLNFELIKKVVEYISKNYPQIKRFDISTNGTLITKETAKFFDKWGIKPTISIDGPRIYHDICRRMKGNGYTFNKILRGIKNIQNISGEFFIEATYTPFMADMGITPLKIARFIENLHPSRYLLKPAGRFQHMPKIEKNIFVFDDIYYFKYTKYIDEYVKYQFSKIEKWDTLFDWGIYNAARCILDRVTKMRVCSLYKFRTIYPNGSIGFCTAFGESFFKIGNDVDGMSYAASVLKKTEVSSLPRSIWFYNFQDLCPAALGFEKLSALDSDLALVHSAEIIWESFLGEFIRVFMGEVE